MPNPKLETYKNKATGTVYDYTDAAAQAALAGILDGTDINNFSDVETALATKVDKVTGKGLSTNDYDDTEKAKVAGAFPRSEQAVLGAKNIIPFPYVQNSVSSDGVTFTSDGEGVVTVNATQSTGTPEMQLTPYITDNRYEGMILSDGGSSTNNNYMRIREALSDGTFVRELSVSDNKLVIPHMESGHKYYIGIRVSNTGVALNNVKFYPMISFDGGEYAPHAMTNKELTEKVFEKGILDASNDLDDIKTTGIYGVGSAPTNSPEGLQYYTLIVSKYQNDGQFTQMAIKTGTIYVRRFFYDTTTYHWDNWYKFTGTVVS